MDTPLCSIARKLNVSHHRSHSRVSRWLVHTFDLPAFCNVRRLILQVQATVKAWLRSFKKVRSFICDVPLVVLQVAVSSKSLDS